LDFHRIAFRRSGHFRREKGFDLRDLPRAEEEVRRRGNRRTIMFRTSSFSGVEDSTLDLWPAI
jgi:hypothetical protein